MINEILLIMLIGLLVFVYDGLTERLDKIIQLLKQIRDRRD